MKQPVTFMCCVISAEGISPTEERIEAIKKTTCPKNSTQLRALHRIINIRNLSSILQPILQMWGLWTIPPSLQEQILSELNKVHPGVARMKAAACSHIWWPGIDRNTKERAHKCKQHFRAVSANLQALFGILSIWASLHTAAENSELPLVLQKHSTCHNWVLPS